LFVIEDLHWCDESSLEYLQHFMRHSISFPWLVLLTYRSDELHPVFINWLAQQDRERRAREIALAHLADLAYHFYEAGAWEKAFEYARRAGEKALSFYAPHAAIDSFTHALTAAYQLSLIPPSSLSCARGQAYELLGEFDRARADYEAALQVARSTGERRAEWEALLRLGMLWARRDYERSGEYERKRLICSGWQATSAATWWAARTIMGRR
jgi:predicted ATPase